MKSFNMKLNNGPELKKFLNISFFISYTLLIIFIDQFRNNLMTNFLIFWLLILPIFICPLFNVLNYKKRDNLSLSITIFQIIALIFLLHFINSFISDYTMFFGDDGYVIIDSAKYLINNNYAVFALDSPDYSKWFVIPILYDTLSIIFNIDFIKTGIFFPSLISAIGSIFIFLFGLEYFKNYKAALLGYLLFGVFVFYNVTHSGPHPEFMAFIFMFMSLFLILKTKIQENKLIWNVLAIISILLTIVTNYTVAFFLMIFIITFFISSTSFKFLKKRVDIKQTISIGFVILVVTAFLAFAIYFGITAFESTVLMGSDLNVPTFRESDSSQIINVYSVKDQITGKGQPLMLLMFGLIIAFGLFKTWNDPKKFHRSFFLGLWSLIGVLIYVFAVILQMGGLYIGPRLMVFFYPIILLAVAFVIINYKLYEKKIIILALICFFIINIASFDFIPNDIVNNGVIPEYYNGQFELSAIQWYQNDKSQMTTSDILTVRAFNYYYGKFSSKSDPSLDNFNIFKSFKFVYLKSKSFDSRKQSKIDKKITVYNNATWLSIVYNDGWWQIYKTYNKN